MVLCTTTEPKATTESEPIHCEQRAFSGFLKSLILPGKNRRSFSTVIGKFVSPQFFEKGETHGILQEMHPSVFLSTRCANAFTYVLLKQMRNQHFLKQSYQLNIENVWKCLLQKSTNSY